MADGTNTVRVHLATPSPASEPKLDAAKTRATMVTIMVMVMVATIVAKRSAPDVEELNGSGRPQAKNSCWALLAICGKTVSR